MPQKRKGPTHGKASTYTNWGCRCLKCRAANTERTRQQRARRTAYLRGIAS